MSVTSLPSRTCSPQSLTSRASSATAVLVSVPVFGVPSRRLTIHTLYPLVVTEQAAGGIVVPGSGRLVSLLGVDDLVIVDMPDTLLVTTRARSQEVKRLVKKCRDSGWKQLL